MEAINAVRPKMWQGRGQDLLGAVAYLDVDGVLAASGGERKQGMDISYKGIWGYHPLIVSLANTREVLYVVNRPGNGRLRCGESFGKAARYIIGIGRRTRQSAFSRARKSDVRRAKEGEALPFSSI